MSHIYYSSLMHCVFSTKERRKTIGVELQPQLWAYIGGIARTHGMKALAVGGIEDHVHILLSLSATMAIAKAMQQIKTASCKWMHGHCGRNSFEWQEGYGAFSIGVTQVHDTIAYICNQEEHHRKCDFQAEFIAFLKKHQIEYDTRYIWG
jgi:REP element-mobilizing transposase RayT